MSTLPDIVYEECVEMLIRQEAELGALLGIETHSKYIISNVRAYAGNGLV